MNPTVFFAEMRKIWRPLPTLVMLVCATLFMLQAIGQASSFTHDAPQSANSLGNSADNAFIADMIERYGPNLDRRTKEGLAGELNRQKRLFSEGLAAIPQARAANIGDYDSFNRYQEAEFGGGRVEVTIDDSGNDVYSDPLLQTVNADQTMSRTLSRIAFLQQVLDRTAETDRRSRDMAALQLRMAFARSITDVFGGGRQPGSYDDQGRPLNGSPRLPQLPSGVTQRIDAIFGHTERYGYLGSDVLSGVTSIVTLMFIAPPICSLIMTLPLIPRDRQRRMLALQYASRTGRRVVWDQMAAISATTLITSAGVCLMMAVPAVWPIRTLMSCPAISVMAVQLIWFDLNLRSYLIGGAAVAMLFSLAVVMLVTFLTRRSSGVIAMLLRAVPPTVICIAPTMLLLAPALFLLSGPLDRWIPLPGNEPMLFALVLLAACALWVVDGIRLRHREPNGV
ncbi:hypothetical protein Uis1B_1807 [Bifidobacterium margollesii]|uniref:ABC-2 family transporter protein n=1 Tax=Bifidobacterium margollesii TaxID=2020964 RepID=A0A2N5J7Y4_9BIFI|nr:hypothetical protein [Bifidobacterium margollesii]PLS30320.1 hypothetical protein Uis1B_1807 [Bifidobacterium margollesii]